MWHVDEGQANPSVSSAALGARVTYRQYGIGEEWGPALGTGWFHLIGAVPPKPAGERVELLVDSAGPTDRRESRPNGWCTGRTVRRYRGAA